jgi:hypothetical protein
MMLSLDFAYRRRCAALGLRLWYPDICGCLATYYLQSTPWQAQQSLPLPRGVFRKTSRFTVAINTKPIALVSVWSIAGMFHLHKVLNAIQSSSSRISHRAKMTCSVESCPESGLKRRCAMQATDPATHRCSNYLPDDAIRESTGHTMGQAAINQRASSTKEPACQPTYSSCALSPSLACGVAHWLLMDQRHFPCSCPSEVGPGQLSCDPAASPHSPN